MSPVFVSLFIGISLLLALFSGLPVTFCLMSVSVICFIIILGPNSLFIAVGALINQISIEVYLSIPLFIFMAAILQNSGIGQKVYEALSQWIGSLRGGLAISTVIATSLIAAVSGIGATGTSIMGMIALPEMYKHKYNKGIVLGSIAAGGALGPLIPPSVLMIIVAGYADLSVGKLFLGGILPGFLITFIYCAYIGIRCYIYKNDGPNLPTAEILPIKDRIKLLLSVVLTILFAAAILVLIYTGVCTPTEASALGAFGSIIITISNKTFTWNSLRKAMVLSLKINSMVLWVLLGGGCYSALVQASGTGMIVSEMITNLSIGSTGTVIVMLIIPLIMGMFIDPVAIVMICVPIYMSIIKMMGLDALWVILLFIMAVIIGYISPPFGVNLFYMKGVAPSGTQMIDVYKGVIPFVLINVFVLILSILFPAIVIYLPSLLN